MMGQKRTWVWGEIRESEERQREQQRAAGGATPCGGHGGAVRAARKGHSSALKASNVNETESLFDAVYMYMYKYVYSVQYVIIQRCHYEDLGPTGAWVNKTLFFIQYVPRVTTSVCHCTNHQR